MTWRLHQAVTRRVDPTITIEVAGRQLRAPLSNQLPFYRRWHPRWDVNIGVLAALVSEYGPGGTMIDIGANIGDSAAIARSRAPELPILCVEGNPRFASLLRTNALALGDVEIAAPVALGDTNETVQGSFVEIAGTAALEASSSGSAVDLLTLDRLLAEHHPRFSRPALLKSDTDGYEARILAGATLTLESAKPVLLLEYEPEMLDRNGIGGLHMLRCLRELGYQATLVYDSMGVPLC